MKIFFADAYVLHSHEVAYAAFLLEESLFHLRKHRGAIGWKFIYREHVRRNVKTLREALEKEKKEGLHKLRQWITISNGGHI